MSIKRALSSLAAVVILSAASVALAQESQTGQSQAAQSGGDDDLVVRGQVDRQIPLPPGDPRTDAQRMRDIRAWDRCVLRAQSAADTDPTRYQAESPEELCASSLGMADRLSLPARSR
ncbi:MAG: hypothetical protein AB7O04_11255 [Hyphomonadaceae bacterium]